MSDDNMKCLICGGTDESVRLLETALHRRQKGFHPSCFEQLEMAVREADIVVALDRQTRKEKLLYGRSTLLLIASHYDPDVAPKLKVLRVPVDFDSDDVEQVGAVCLNQKGHVDE